MDKIENVPAKKDQAKNQDEQKIYEVDEEKQVHNTKKAIQAQDHVFDISNGVFHIGLHNISAICKVAIEIKIFIEDEEDLLVRSMQRIEIIKVRLGDLVLVDRLLDACAIKIRR